MDRQTLEQEIKQIAVEGRITCPQAMELAKKASIERSDIGKILDDIEIKITACQLGCF